MIKGRSYKKHFRFKKKINPDIGKLIFKEIKKIKTITLSQTIVSVDLGYMAQEDQNKIREKIENLSRQINALRKSQLARVK